MLGLGLGSLYAMLGAGLVVVYRGSGVINFAHGAMAMYGVFTFDEARRNGQLQLPWVDFLPTHSLNVPVTITPRRLTDRGRSWLAFGVALLMAALLGLGAHFLVFRPLRNAAPLGKVIALGRRAAVPAGRRPAQLRRHRSRQPESILPDKPLRQLPRSRPLVPRNTLWAAGIAVLIGIALWAVFQFTRFGLATRAAAGNEKGAVLLGYSPQFARRRQLGDRRR